MVGAQLQQWTCCVGLSLCPSGWRQRSLLGLGKLRASEEQKTMSGRLSLMDLIVVDLVSIGWIGLKRGGRQFARRRQVATGCQKLNQFERKGQAISWNGSRQETG